MRLLPPVHAQPHVLRVTRLSLWRVAQIPGGGLQDSLVIKGMVLRRDAEGSIKRVADAKVAVFAQGVDTVGTETKVRAVGPRARGANDAQGLP